MFTRLKLILEMIRFSHTLFALPFALLAAMMAWTLGAQSDPPTPWRWQQLLGIVLCMVTARSAAMAINRLADRKIDADNRRTAGRHIPAGLLGVGQVLFFAILCCAAFIASTLLFLPNRLPLMLSIGVLLFLIGYSYTKRFTSLAHFWLGAALMLAPICAWIAIRGQQVLANPADILPALVLGLAVFFWVSGFDMIYACQDVDFDRRAHLHSVPAKIGIGGALRLAAVCHLLMVVLLVALPSVNRALSLGWIYYTGIGATALLLGYEHWIIRPTDLDRVNIAFFNINAVVSIGLFIVGTIDLLV